MLIIGTFQYSLELEEALAELEHHGISGKDILAVPMNTNLDTSQELLSESNDFHPKAIEVGIACATPVGVIGTSVGFALKWGPIVWGLLAAFIGFVIGFGVYSYLNKNPQRNIPKKLPEATIIVQCSEENAKTVKGIMWKYEAITVGQVLKSA